MKTNILIRFLAIALFGGNYECQAQSPFGGIARTIPGIIEAEDFELGGEGVGYHDSTTKNQGIGCRLEEAPGIKGMKSLQGNLPGTNQMMARRQ